MSLSSKAPRFKSRFITDELACLFSQSDSEGEFEGFSEDEETEDRDCFNKRRQTKMAGSEDDSDVNTGFYSDGEEASRPKRRRSLLVALRFPMKRPSTPKQKPQKGSVNKAAKATLQQRGSRRQRKHQDEEELQDDEDSEEEGLSLSLKKRNKNIQENRAMLASLFADLSTMADLALPSTTPKKERVAVKAPRKRKSKLDMKSKRKNPSRKARPLNFAVEEEMEEMEPPSQRKPRKVDLKKLMEVDKDIVRGRQKIRKQQKKKKRRYAVRPVKDITKEDLDNIAYRSKVKIYDKKYGSSCHQCRQKTLDTKTVCRSGFCVKGRGQFCGLCLKNRYGEDVGSVLLDPTWACPICRRICNCSVCRKKEGRCATGLLVTLARFNGHDNVHQYLKKIQKEVKQSPEN